MTALTKLYTTGSTFLAGMGLGADARRPIVGYVSAPGSARSPPASRGTSIPLSTAPRNCSPRFEQRMPSTSLRELALAQTKIEEAVMWAVKGFTR